MADFCKQCSLATFGEDFGDLAGITPQGAWDQGSAACVLCEGCTYIQVAPDGTCVSPDCHEKHGLSEEVNKLPGIALFRAGGGKS